MTLQQEKERAWQFLTLLSRSKNEKVSLFGYEKNKLLQLLPTLQPVDVLTNGEGDVTAYLFNRQQVIDGLKKKYKYNLNSMDD